MIDKSSPLELAYEIVSIQRAEPPLGATGSNWHCYVIAFEGTKTIRGHQQGNLSAVTREVEQIVAQLNERHLGKRGRVQIALGKKTDE